MNIDQQIASLKATQAAKVRQMSAISLKAAEAGRSLSADEASAFDELKEQIDSMADDLKRMGQLKQLSSQFGPRSSPDSGPTIIVKRDADESFKGQNFTRKAIAQAIAKITGQSVGSVAEQRWGKTNPTLVAIIKANEVAGGGSDSGEWGAELVQADTRYTGDFIEFLYAATIYDQLPLRQVPANVAIKGQDGSATGYWVGQSKAIPVSKADFSSVNLTRLKVAALSVISNELIMDSSPAAEALVQNALIQASSQRVDATFLSATATSAGVSPAGLLNGLSAITSAGTDYAAVRTDVSALYAPFIAAHNSSGLAFVTDMGTKKALQLLTSPFGNAAFPEITSGNLLGDPIYAGDNVTAGYLILLKPSDIYRIGDTGVQVSISRDAMIEQNSVPTGATDTPVAASATMVSMFQEESTAFKVVRHINFAKRRASAVAYINDAAYGSVTSPP